jgi:hypothetical protein
MPKSQENNQIKEPLPHPEVQKTLLQMKEDGMLDPEMVEMVKKEMMHEKMVQSAVKRNPKLTHKEASEMLEAYGF